MGKINPGKFTLGALGAGLLVSGVLIDRHYRADMRRAYRRVSSGGKVIQTACGPVEFAEIGEGPAVLSVHGTGGGYDQGELIARRLGGPFRWIAPSRFGYLKAGLSAGASSLDQAKSHACLLDALDIQKVSVVGLSAGGPSSLLFALRYPERTRSLVLVSAVSHAIPARPSVMDRVYHSIVNDFIYWSFVHLSKPALLAALGVPFAEQKTLSKQDVSQAYAFLDSMMPMAARRDGLIFDLTRMAQYNADQIQNIQAPTLVIHALNDTLVPFEQAQFTASRIPGAQLVTLEKGGHFAILFSPQARAKIVEFLEQTNL